MNRNDITICNADKGGAVVIIDIDDYIKEAMRQLSDTKKSLMIQRLYIANW